MKHPSEREIALNAGKNEMFLGKVHTYIYIKKTITIHNSVGCRSALGTRPATNVHLLLLLMSLGLRTKDCKLRIGSLHIRYSGMCGVEITMQPTTTIRNPESQCQVTQKSKDSRAIAGPAIQAENLARCISKHQSIEHEPHSSTTMTVVFTVSSGYGGNTIKGVINIKVRHGFLLKS